MVCNPEGICPTLQPPGSRRDGLLTALRAQLSCIIEWFGLAGLDPFQEPKESSSQGMLRLGGWSCWPGRVPADDHSLQIDSQTVKLMGRP